jgi:hypothetical protein
LSMTLYMVIRAKGDPVPVYRRFAERGRMTPEAFASRAGSTSGSIAATSSWRPMTQRSSIVGSQTRATSSTSRCAA